MEPRFHMGMMLVILGIVIILTGFAVMYIDNIPYIGRLPGDFNVYGKGWSFHFPFVTCLILSVILTIILNLLFRR